MVNNKHLDNDEKIHFLKFLELLELGDVNSEEKYYRVLKDYSNICPNIDSIILKSSLFIAETQISFKSTQWKGFDQKVGFDIFTQYAPINIRNIIKNGNTRDINHYYSEKHKTISGVATAIGRQVVVVDVQTRFSIPEKIINGIIDYCKGFDNIVFIYDILDGESMDMYKEMKDSTFNIKALKIHKQFGFFRDWMDSGVDDDEIVKVAKQLYKNKMHNSYEIPEYYEDTGIGRIHFPHILANKLNSIITSNPILVGGQEDFCLKEVKLLLESIDKKPEINNKYVY